MIAGSTSLQVVPRKNERVTVCNLSTVNCSCKGVRYTFMTLSKLNLFDTHNKMSFRAISISRIILGKMKGWDKFYFFFSFFSGFNS